MDRAELMDLTRRALTLATERSTDLAPGERRQAADAYTSGERFRRERELVRRSPQLVGYSSELPASGSFCTKTVMDVPVLLTRAEDGVVRAFQNVCAHRQARVVDGCGQATRFACPYHAWTYDALGVLRHAPGREGFPDKLAAPVGLIALPAKEFAGFLWVGLDPEGELDVEGHLGPLGPELASWGIGGWTPIGEKVLEADVSWKLALDTFAENYHFATVHQKTFAELALSNCTVFDAFGQHHRLAFPMRHITDLNGVPEDEWEPMHNLVVIYALHPNIVLSVTVANGEIFRVYPGDGPGRSVTVHQNAAPLDLSQEGAREGAEQVFEYAHATVRDEDFPIAGTVQANLRSGVQPELVFGRNEPGLQHRHATWEAALAEH